MRLILKIEEEGYLNLDIQLSSSADCHCLCRCSLQVVQGDQNGPGGWVVAGHPGVKVIGQGPKVRLRSGVRSRSRVRSRLGVSRR